MLDKSVAHIFVHSAWLQRHFGFCCKKAIPWLSPHTPFFSQSRKIFSSKKYKSALCCEPAKLVQVLYQYIGSDILSDSVVFRLHFIFLIDNLEHHILQTGNGHKTVDRATFMQITLNKDSFRDSFEDEIAAFPRATPIEDKRTNPFE